MPASLRKNGQLNLRRLRSSRKPLTGRCRPQKVERSFRLPFLPSPWYLHPFSLILSTSSLLFSLLGGWCSLSLPWRGGQWLGKGGEFLQILFLEKWSGRRGDKFLTQKSAFWGVVWKIDCVVCLQSRILRRRRGEKLRKRGRLIMLWRGLRRRAWRIAHIPRG